MTDIAILLRDEIQRLRQVQGRPFLMRLSRASGVRQVTIWRFCCDLRNIRLATGSRLLAALGFCITRAEVSPMVRRDEEMTEEELRRRCREIRAEWDEGEEMRRRAVKPVGWLPHGVRQGGLRTDGPGPAVSQ